MTATATQEQQQGTEPVFQWWMVAFLGMGVGFNAFAVLMISPYVISVTGNAGDGGVVMAVLGLSAVLGPVLGGFADRYRAHRLVLSLGVLGMALGFTAYALSARTQGVFFLDAVLLGLAVAAISAVGPSFVVGAGLSPELEARRLTVLNVLIPVGQLLGGLLLAAVAAVQWDYSARFWLGAALSFGFFVVVWLTSAEPARQIRVAEPEERSAGRSGERSGGLGPLLMSMFGLFLLTLVLGFVANNGIGSQIGNILPKVYGFTDATTSGLISLAGLLAIGVFVAAGAILKRHGPMALYVVGCALRLVGALGMAVLGLIADSPLLLAAAAMQLLFASSPILDLVFPVLAARLSPVGAATATGWAIAALAAGTFIGNLVGGMLAEELGFNAVNWLGAAGAALAMTMVLLGIAPAWRRRESMKESDP